jgi:hypothetical protein
MLGQHRRSGTAALGVRSSSGNGGAIVSAAQPKFQHVRTGSATGPQPQVSRGVQVPKQSMAKYKEVP